MFTIAEFVKTDFPFFFPFPQVDLSFPEDKMQFFDEFPPCCEKKSVPLEDYSDFMRDTLEKTGSKPTKQTKLVSDLKEKKNYPKKRPNKSSTSTSFFNTEMPRRLQICL